WQLAHFFFSSRRRHTRSDRDWSSDVCSSDLKNATSSPALCIGTCWPWAWPPPALCSSAFLFCALPPTSRLLPRPRPHPPEWHKADRKSVVQGKRGDRRGRRATKRKQ